MRYEIVTCYGSDFSQLVGTIKTEVDEFIKDGWKPEGGLAVVANADMTQFQVSQVLVK